MSNKNYFTTLLLAFLLVNSGISKAQNIYLLLGTYYYAEVGAVIGNQTCLKGAANLIVYNKYVLSAGYYMCSRATPNLPDGMAAPLSIGLPSSTYPQQTSNMMGLMFGKAYFTKSRKSRLLLRGGICFGKVSTPGYFSTSSGSAYPFTAESTGPIKTFTSNKVDYTYSVNTENASGFLFHPTYEFPFAEYFGVSTGIFFMATRNSSTIGIDVNLMLGKCRHKISYGD